MGNSRGNYYSQKHTTLPTEGPLSRAYWNFSFDEIGHYDTPACIDYVLNTTGFEQLNYLGHSQGCPDFFIMMHYRPEYNEKVDRMIALAPAVYLNHATAGPLRSVANLERQDRQVSYELFH